MTWTGGWRCVRAVWSSGGWHQPLYPPLPLLSQLPAVLAVQCTATYWAELLLTSLESVTTNLSTAATAATPPQDPAFMRVMLL